MSASSSPSRRLWVLAALAALLVAGILSGFASSAPDGLEHVAETVGFSEQAQEHAAAGSPLSDYQVRGVEDERLSTGMSGVVGVLLVLGAAGGLASVVSRRRASEQLAPARSAGPGQPASGPERRAPSGADVDAGPAAPLHGS